MAISDPKSLGARQRAPCSSNGRLFLVRAACFAFGVLAVLGPTVAVFVGVLLSVAT